MDISSMLEVQVNEVKENESKENVTPKDLIPSTARIAPGISQEESNFYKFMFRDDIASVRFRKLHCTACDIHIGSAPRHADNMFQHPVLRTLLCGKCREFYGDGTFEQGDDATDMFCRWCANGGNLYCCSYCSNTFCYKCIKRNFDSVVRKKIEADEKWKCFVCHPADLYASRAVCWALLQHVQTVTRILQNDKKMSPLEREEKMNLDESQCCPRRPKRKRRRTVSNSEEEDETYIPESNEVPTVLKRKKLKRFNVRRKVKHMNGRINEISTPIPIMPRITLPLQNALNMIHEPLTTFSTHQTNTELKNLPMRTEGATIAPVSNNSIQYRLESTTAQTSIYNSNVINVLPTASLLQSTLTAGHSIVLPSSQISYQSGYCATPMVTIPKQINKRMNQPRILLPKPSITPNFTESPNIINLDSDSDEPIFIETASNNILIDERSNTAGGRQGGIVPVALVSTKNKYNEAKEAQPWEIVPTRLENKIETFHKGVLENCEIESALKRLRIKFRKLCEITKTEKFIENEEKHAYHKMKQFHQNIRTTIMQLVNINDAVVRKYGSWKRSREIRDNAEQRNNDSNKIRSSKGDIKLPLDMTCVNDSAVDSDNDEDVEPSIISPSEEVCSMNANEEVLCFRKKETVECGTGDSSILCVNKAVQVYDIVSRDFENCIGYSLLMKADYDPMKKNSVLKPVAVHNEHFGKYEEQFIFHLQHIEDHGIVTEEMCQEVVPDSTDTVLTDLIEADLSNPSEIQENTDPLTSTRDSCEDTNSVTQSSTKSNITNTDEVMETESLASVSKMVTNLMPPMVDDIVPEVTKVGDKVNADKGNSLNNQNCNGNVKQTDETKQPISTKDETLLAVKTLMGDLCDSSKSDLGDAAMCTVNEEDCTIIDD